MPPPIAATATATAAVKVACVHHTVPLNFPQKVFPEEDQFLRVEANTERVAYKTNILDFAFKHLEIGQAVGNC